MERVNTHCHCVYSGHGTGTIAEYADAAAAAGLTTLAFTEHFPLSAAFDPDEYLSMRPQMVDAYLAEIDEARARHTAAGRGAQFVDVDYRDLVADPLGTVGNIYRAFGIDLTDAAQQAMSAMHTASRTGPRQPKHTYSLADYGLSEADVRVAFDT